MRDSGQLFLMVHQAMVGAGLDLDAIYRRIGYDAHRENGGDKLRERRPLHELQLGFWRTVESVTGDADIGLRLAPHLPVYRGEILEYLMLSCPSFGEGLGRVTRYLRLVSDALEMRVAEDGEILRVLVVASPLDAPQVRHTEICVLQGLIQCAREVTQGAAAPQHVRLHCPRLSPQAEYERVFGCGVSFDAPTSEIHIDRKLLDYRPPRFNRELFRLHDQLAAARLDTLSREDLLDRIRAVFARRLELGDCQLEHVARELALAPRTLRHELSQAGTSFSAVLDGFRLELARRLLSRTDERLEHIAYVAGFSEPSGFHRAFKRWTGETPAQFRDSRRARHGAIETAGAGEA